MKLNMCNRRVWLFRGLVAIAAALMLASAILPWWTAQVVPEAIGVSPSFTITIYQYGIPSNPGVEYASAEDITPLYQTVLALIYIGVSVGLMLYSTWLKGRKGWWVLGGIGLIYIGYAAIAAFIVIANRIGDFGIPLQGTTSIMWGGQKANIYADLRVGYWLAYATGLMCIALAIVRKKIIVSLNSK